MPDASHLGTGSHSPGGWDCHVHLFDAAAAVASGHYQPATRTLDEIETLSSSQGVRHLVLVQPSVYGSDNSVLLRSLGTSAGRHRGVIVVAPADPGGQAWDEAQALGVRGVRINRVSPVGDASSLEHDIAPWLHRAAPRLRQLGWHVQWYVHAAELPALAALQRSTGLSFVLDHLAGIRIDEPMAPASLDALQALAGGGAWLKLSAWYRLGRAASPDALTARIAAVATPFADRVVWASDWPHTTFSSPDAVSYIGLMAPAQAALGAERWHAAVTINPARLYGP